MQNRHGIEDKKRPTAELRPHFFPVAGSSGGPYLSFQILTSMCISMLLRSNGIGGRAYHELPSVLLPFFSASL